MLTLCGLHGLFGRPEHWDPLREALGGRWPVLAPALAFTLEAAPEGVPGASRHVAAWLAARGAGRLVLLGNSLGGHVAIDLTLRCPGRVVGLVLTGSAGLLERTFTRGVPASPSPGFVRSRLEEVFFDPARVTDALVAEVHRYLRDRANARAVLAWARATKGAPVRDRLGAVRVPTLLVWGEADRVTPLPVAEAFLAGLPDARLVAIPRCGHAPMLEAPAAFAGHVGAFVGELDARGWPPAAASTGLRAGHAG